MKTKIVQIEGIYKNFLNQIISQKPYLEQQNYFQRLETIFNSGWSSGQNVVPYMNPARWESYYLMPGCEWLQRQWAKENGLPQQIPLDHILYYQLEKIKPDVLYISDIGSFNLTILNILNKKPFVVMWHATSLEEHYSWSDVDLLLSGISAIRSKGLDLGVHNVENFMSGAPSTKSLQGVTHGNRQGDIAFIGSFIGGLHDSRAELIKELACLIPQYEISIYTAQPFDCFGLENIKFFSPVYGGDVVNVYASYKIVIDARADFNLDSEDRYARDTSNMRIFEATKSGALLLTEKASNLADYFEIGGEVEVYSSLEELSSKITQFCDLKGAGRRNSIAYSGYIRTIKDHTIEARALWFSRIISKYL